MKVLVVEDTEDARIFLVDQLSVSGYEVESAEDGVEALTKALASPPDLIISDILMPEMDGFEFCTKVKKEPSLKDLPFIFYTATYTESSDQQFALSLGASRFVVKPEDPVKLLKIIEEELESSTVSQDALAAETPEADFEVQYSEVLSRKLDKKIKDLESQKEQLRIITDAMPALIAEIDDSYCYQYVNEACEKWFLTSRENIIGKKVSEVIGEEAFNVIQPCIEKALKGDESSYEGYMLDANGKNRYILARYIPYENKDSETHMCFAFVNDLSEKKQVDDEKKQLLLQLRHSQKMDAIGQLSGGIAHDFNNILSIILGYTELATIGGYDGTNNNIEDYIEQIRIAGFRGKALVDQLMAFSRRTGEKVEYSVDIKPLVKEVSKLVKETFPSTISIELDIDSSTPNIEGNLIQLHQVIMNLLVNARDAIDCHGKISINLGHEFVDKFCCASCQNEFSGHFIVLSISDDGAGIEVEDLEKIFELFFTTKEVGKGTGMGLSTVQTIVHESGGHLLLESEVGIGTVFKIFIPVSNLNEADLEKHENTVDINALTDNSLRVMVVDDEESLAEFLKDLLTIHGYDVTMFTDSQKAVQALKDNPNNFDIVVTDQVMPILTGVEMVKEMLQVRPDLPVILCSGDCVSSDGFIKMKGINAILQKPVSTKELLQELTHFSTFEK